MQIRKATKSDKKPVLDFCQSPYSGIDYIANVWDFWLKDGVFLTMEHEGKPIGVCHASFSKNQVWVEGLRINPKFWQRGYGSSLVLKTEQIAKRKNYKISRMIISNGNKKSIKLAKSLGYKIEDKWYLYNIRPKRKQSLVIPAINSKQIENLIDSDTYSKSWKWFEFDKPAMSELIKKKKILVFTQNKKTLAVGIWNDSEIDDDVLQVGYLNGTKAGMKKILSYMQNKGYEQNSRRIQILAQQKIKLKMKDLDKRMLFCLMKKEL
ncbi:GNAT family N-acetyltransferase [Candidatus Nitrosotenuis chungbukensis]|uniref:GNAT family N-acetyltransferase n=1 Tax=Candidatus Nitrosotenuis chungbukensis TaxID=1353246 RepID=UPI0005B2B259|nr:GNAT family N-acetyltransferase [Candidatus Nitrosotenuis chungbukensis]